MDTTASKPDLFGHPRGLWVLAGTEMWDRISFHGMQAMLVLYMTGDLLLHPERVMRIIGFAGYRAAVEAMTGPLSNQTLATQTFGIYLAMVTGLPLLGGWVGDKFTGRRIAVSTGAGLMTAGHFALAFDRTFLIALVLLMFGAGFLRGNLSAQVKSLYKAGDRRETDAFQYYYLGINFGAFVAPIASGSVAAIWGWHAGFAVAGFGMLIGLLVYLSGGRFLPREAIAARRKPGEKRPPLTPRERRNIIGLMMVWPVSLCFWTAQAQIWNVYNVWVRDHVNLQVGSFTVPVPWFQSLDGLAPAVFTPLALWIWARQARREREPDHFGKLAFGCLLFGASVALLAAGPIVGGVDGRAPVLWPVLFHLLSNFGAVYFAPVMLAFFAARAPQSWRGTMLGINALSISAGSLLSGRMGGLYETLTPTQFWLINAAICGGAGVGLLIAAPALRRWFGPETDAEAEAERIPLPPKVDADAITA